MRELIEGDPGVIDDRYSKRVIGAAIAVHKALGPGFLESVYHRALRCELTALGLAWNTEVEVPILYRGTVVGRHRLDLVVGGELVVELKSAKRLEYLHFAQVRSYLAAAGKRVGLLLNFDQTRLTVRRIVDQAAKDRIRGFGVSALDHPSSPTTQDPRD
ncbi:MAG TPA: GxxExxY protein [Gemmatimonadales bacterium]|nr:GxxExxY protein [Gemmatimonadales bacterium]